MTLRTTQPKYYTLQAYTKLLRRLGEQGKTRIKGELCEIDGKIRVKTMRRPATATSSTPRIRQD